eukprot:SAG11_NODE_2755_length_3007_cov_4.405777_1_plen_283_part_00
MPLLQLLRPLHCHPCVQPQLQLWLRTQRVFAARIRRGAANDGGAGSADNPYADFMPGREWTPVDEGRLDKGNARREQQRLARSRWARTQRTSSDAKVEVVCHGNIARSQVFAHFLERWAHARQVPLVVGSCGVAEEDAYGGWRALIDETERRLGAATPPGLPLPQLTRDYWTPAVASRLRDATLILAADSSIEQELLRLLEKTSRLDPPPIRLFREFCGDGRVDFIDTYDRNKGAQDAARYDNCFVELEFMAEVAIRRIEAELDRQVRWLPNVLRQLHYACS